jgi:hypothetical protein
MTKGQPDDDVQSDHMMEYDGMPGLRSDIRHARPGKGFRT